jgi:hypothetical protein
MTENTAPPRVLPPVDLDEAARAFLAHAEDPNILVGPVVWTPRWGTYFVIAGGDAQGFFCEQFVLHRSYTPDECNLARMALIAMLVGGKPHVIHDLSSELEMAKLAEVIWPGERTRAIRMGVEAEDAAHAHPYRH